MKKCENCGRESMTEAKFCEFCGAKFPEEETTVQENVVQEIEPVTVQADEHTAPPLPELNIQPADEYYNDAVTHNNKGLVWLILSSVLTLLSCCCIMPFNFFQIATIIISAISVSKFNKKQYEESERLAKTAMIVFFSILGVAFVVFILMIALGTFSNFAETYSDFYSEFY